MVQSRDIDINYSWINYIAVCVHYVLIGRTTSLWAQLMGGAIGNGECSM